MNLEREMFELSVSVSLLIVRVVSDVTPVEIRVRNAAVSRVGMAVQDAIQGVLHGE